MQKNERVTDFADWLTSGPGGGPLWSWGSGIFAAGILVAYGCYVVAAQQGTSLNLPVFGFPQDRGFGLQKVQGATAVSLGIAIACLGLFMHFQWFWGNHRRLSRYFEIGKYAALASAAIATIAHVILMLSQANLF